MGLGYHMTEALVREHIYKPIEGDVLMLGRQTVFLPFVEICELMREQGLTTEGVELASMEIDSTTLNRPENAVCITDRALFGLLGGKAVVRALDHTDYEGAEVIHDLRRPIPPSLIGTADFIVDGSVLDNVYDPAVALMNANGLLRPHGRLLAIDAMGGPNIPSYTNITPLWFLDYFVLNGFVDCKVYIIAYCQTAVNTDNWVLTIDLEMLLKDPSSFFSVSNFNTPLQMAVMVLAEKGEHTTIDRIPNQAHYRPQEEWKTYFENLSAIIASPRPHLTRTTNPNIPTPPSGLKVVGPLYTTMVEP